MKEVERPAPVLVAALNHGFDGVTGAAVGFDSCIPQIIESAQDVVVPFGRKSSNSVLTLRPNDRSNDPGPILKEGVFALSVRSHE